MRTFLLACLTGCLVIAAAATTEAQQTSGAANGGTAARKTAAAPTPAQLEILRRGIRLHDEEHYDEAIALYQQVLSENPDCVIAIGELANSYLLSKNLPKAIATARQALTYDTPDVANLYVVIGSAYDDMGDTAKAIDAYREGIAAAPHGLLYFNLALTYLRQRDDANALTNLKRAAVLTPNHASTQYELARVLGRHGYFSQALMALSRYLILEPTTARTGDAYRAWLSGWQDAAIVGGDGKITVDVRPQADAAEGDFLALDVALGVTRGGVLATAGDKSPAELLVEQLQGWFSMLTKSDATADRTAFSWRYYAPYFVELQRRGYVEPFAYWVSQATDLPGVAEWIAEPANRERGTAFIQWSQQYQWPKD